MSHGPTINLDGQWYYMTKKGSSNPTWFAWVDLETVVYSGFKWLGTTRKGLRLPKQAKTAISDWCVKNGVQLKDHGGPHQVIMAAGDSDNDSPLFQKR